MSFKFRKDLSERANELKLSLFDDWSKTKMNPVSKKFREERRDYKEFRKKQEEERQKRQSLLDEDSVYVDEEERKKFERLGRIMSRESGLKAARDVIALINNEGEENRAAPKFKNLVDGLTVRY